MLVTDGFWPPLAAQRKAWWDALRDMGPVVEKDGRRDRSLAAKWAVR